MLLKLLTLLTIAVALHAEDKLPFGNNCASLTGKPVSDDDCAKLQSASAPLATVEQLQKVVVEQKQEIARLQEQVPYLQRKLQIYQQALFACQDAQIDAEAKAPKPSR